MSGATSPPLVASPLTVKSKPVPPAGSVVLATVNCAFLATVAVSVSLRPPLGLGVAEQLSPLPMVPVAVAVLRSGERRVGLECLLRGRSRSSPFH